MSSTKEDKIIAKIDAEDKYPLLIDSDYRVDNILDEFPELELFPFIRNLISEEGREDASKIIWCYILLLDPRRWLSEKMLHEEKMKLISENFFLIDWDHYNGSMIPFIQKKVLINDDIIFFSKLKMDFDNNINKSEKYSVKMENKRVLDTLKKKVYAIVSDSERIRAQGKKQPGGKTWLRK